jgi:hypothetical protein
MYLPFLGAFGVALMALSGKEKYAFWAWSILLLIVITTFLHHVTKSLPLSF